jgi:hypothetical protein
MIDGFKTFWSKGYIEILTKFTLQIKQENYVQKIARSDPFHDLPISGISKTADLAIATNLFTA